jgi:PIN domain nuclease of toxin-antitoxin system
MLEIRRDNCRSIKSLDFDSDPADKIIAAMRLVHRVPLLTRDDAAFEASFDCFVEAFSTGQPCQALTY